MGLGAGILVLASIIVVLAVFVPSQPAFALHQSENMTWQLIMISSDPACSNYHYQMTQKYYELAQEYFKAYQFENTSNKPICMTELKYNTEYQLQENVDLAILVYDKNKGQAELHSNSMGGFYSHLGNEWTHHHSIVFCDCPNFYYSDPTWILTHELSHFILYYLGYDRSIVEDLVHSIDAKSDYCVEVAYDDSCKALRMRLETSNYYATVVPPYQPAIGKKIIPVDLQQEKISDSPYRKEMQMEITKWWLEGKITDANYEKSLDILLEKMGITTKESKNMFSAESPNVVFTDPPLTDKQDIEEHSETLELASVKSREILAMNPFGEEYVKSITEKDSQKIPEWFKTRALWWVTDKVSDTEFLSGMEYLYNSSPLN